MAILKIARMGHPVLRRRADPVTDQAAPEVRLLVRDMLETLADIGGVGLAAPQVHVSKRVAIFEVPATRAAPPGNGDSAAQAVAMTVLINPVIEPLSDEKEPGWEACLSVPGLTGVVPRFTRIRYRGFGLRGERIEREASGFHARVVQHECDHLDGILYPMRMTDMSTLVFAEELRHGAPDDTPRLSEEAVAAIEEA